MDFLSNMGANGQLFITILVYIAVFGGMYLIMVRPQQKRRKEEEQLRNSLKLGDEVTTIGGIVGRVINIKDGSDSLVIETANDKIKIKRWAISSVDNKAQEVNQ